MTNEKRVSYQWSISIYHGNSPDKMYAMPGSEVPTITADIVTDADAAFVADPFMIYTKEKWYMFFEVLNQENGLGEIGFASSKDLKKWAYEEMALREPFHLSYPKILMHDGAYYMIPETRQAGEIRLYSTEYFPSRWKKQCALVKGDYADATIFQHNGLWWMYALHDVSDLHLFWAEKLTGPWNTHPQSPLIENNLRISRPAGSVIQTGGRLYRLAQDGVPLYGSRVRMMEVTSLSTTEYSEFEIDSSPVLQGARRGWNAIAMHHMDAHQLNDRSWIACVDGATPKFSLAGHQIIDSQPEVEVDRPQSKGKVCFVAGEYAPTIGGLSKSATRISKFLNESGYDVFVIVPVTGKPSAEVPKPEIVDGVQVFRVPVGNDLLNSGGISLTACIWQLDQKHGFDLFHGFFLPLGYVCLMAIKNISRPLVVSVRGNDAVLWSSADKRDIIDKMLEYTSCITTVNKALLNLLKIDSGYKGTTRFIKNSIPEPTVHWTLNNKNRGIIGTIGKFQPKKQIPTAIESYAKVDENLRSGFQLIGEYIHEKLEDEVTTTIESLGIDDEVSRCGFIRGNLVADKLKGFHVFLFTSSSEGFPNVVLEAAAVGTPIVCTEFPGIHDYLEHMVNAVIVPVGDTVAISGAINAILSDDELAFNLSNGAKAFAEGLSCQNEKKEWLSLYNELITSEVAEMV